MIAFVTGSNGFIGSFLIEHLLSEGHEVRCLVRKTSNLRWIQNLPVELAYGTLENPTSLALPVRGVDWIFHLAGLTKAKNPYEFYQANFEGVENLVRECKKYNPGIKKFIFVSSQAAGGPAPSIIPKKETDESNPVSIYGDSKWVAEKSLLNPHTGLPVTVIRPPAVYGPRDTELFKLFKIVTMGIRPIIAGGTNMASLVHVHDLVHGIVLAAKSDLAVGKIFYISGDGAYTWNEIFALICTALNKKTIPLHIPLLALKIFSTVNSFVARLKNHPPMLSKDKLMELQQPFWLCDNSRAKKELGFEPQMSLQQGIQETAKWYQDNGWL